MCLEWGQENIIASFQIKISKMANPMTSEDILHLAFWCNEQARKKQALFSLKVLSQVLLSQTNDVNFMIKSSFKNSFPFIFHVLFYTLNEKKIILENSTFRNIYITRILYDMV